MSETLWIILRRCFYQLLPEDGLMWRSGWTCKSKRFQHSSVFFTFKLIGTSTVELKCSVCCLKVLMINVILHGQGCVYFLGGVRWGNIYIYIYSSGCVNVWDMRLCISQSIFTLVHSMFPAPRGASSVAKALHQSFSRTSAVSLLKFTLCLG